jgi:hypothetical protein
VRVHALYCTLALLLASLLYREVRKASVEGDFEHVISTLAGIRGVLDLPLKGAGERKGIKIRLSRRSSDQQRLLDLLQLQHFQPTSLRDSAGNTATPTVGPSVAAVARHSLG